MIEIGMSVAVVTEFTQEVVTESPDDNVNQALLDDYYLADGFIGKCGLDLFASQSGLLDGVFVGVSLNGDLITDLAVYLDS